MNQQELVDAVAEAIGTTKADAGKAVAAVLDAIRDSLKRGEKVGSAASASSRRRSVGRARAATCTPARRSISRP
jgi:DNA-binding protein HU-beta